MSSSSFSTSSSSSSSSFSLLLLLILALFYEEMVTIVKGVESFTTTLPSLSTDRATIMPISTKKTATRKKSIFLYSSSTSSSSSSSFDPEKDNENNNNKEEEEAKDLLLETISDEEALLACQAYLRKKRKLPWKQHEERLQKRRDYGSIGNKDGRGYFWEDPQELKYLRRGRRRRRRKRRRLSSSSSSSQEKDEYEYDINNAEEEEEEEYDDYDDEDDDDIFNNENQDNNDDEEEEDDDEKDDETKVRNDASEDYSRVIIDTYDESPFTSYPLYPPMEHIRRSNAAKKTWSNPEWRQKWYDKRWGPNSKSAIASSFGEKEEEEESSSSSSSSQERKRSKIIANRVSNIPNDVLTSDELASLTDEEVKEAIQMYVIANTKRSKSHLKRAKERKERRERSLSEDMKLLKDGKQRSNDDGNNTTIGKEEAEEEKGKDTPNKEMTEKEEKKNNVILSFEVPTSSNDGSDGNNASFMEQEMRKLQHKRAEVAKRAYQTRLKNLKTKKNTKQNTTTNTSSTTTTTTTSKKKTTTKTKKKNDPLIVKTKKKATTIIDASSSSSSSSKTTNNKKKKKSTTTTTTAAQMSLESIQSALDSHQLPSSYDVTQILIPGKLPLRRDVMRRILDECFDLRGKCIPDYYILEERVAKQREEGGEGEDVDDVPMQFVTHCPIQDLGDFVLEKLREQEGEQEQQQEKEERERE